MKKPEKLMSIINVGLLTYHDEEFGVKSSFEDFLAQEFNNSMKEFLKDRKKVAQVQKLQILLAGLVEPPSVCCVKEMQVHKLGEKVIPLAVKKGLMA